MLHRLLCKIDHDLKCIILYFFLQIWTPSYFICENWVYPDWSFLSSALCKCRHYPCVLVLHDCVSYCSANQPPPPPPSGPTPYQAVASTTKPVFTPSDTCRMVLEEDQQKTVPPGGGVMIQPGLQLAQSRPFQSTQGAPHPTFQGGTPTSAFQPQNQAYQAAATPPY